MIIFNLGAHLGSFTDACLKEYPDIQMVYCFEPLKSNYVYLVEKYKDNRNVTVLHCAVSNFDGTANLYTKFNKDKTVFGSDGCSLYGNKTNVSSSSSLVRVMKLSTFIREEGVPYIDLLKMDVEGSEYDIFDDILENNLYAKIGKIYFEDHARKIQGLAKRRERFIESAKRIGIVDRIYLEVKIDEYSPLREVMKL